MFNLAEGDAPGVSLALCIGESEERYCPGKQLFGSEVSPALGSGNQQGGFDFGPPLRSGRLCDSEKVSDASK